MPSRQLFGIAEDNHLVTQLVEALTFTNVRIRVSFDTPYFDSVLLKLIAERGRAANLTVACEDQAE